MDFPGGHIASVVWSINQFIIRVPYLWLCIFKTGRQDSHDIFTMRSPEERGFRPQHGFHGVLGKLENNMNRKDTAPLLIHLRKFNYHCGKTHESSWRLIRIVIRVE